MLRIYRILVSVLVLAGSAVGFGISLTGCGQQGALYLPTEPAAAGRATLPQALRPGSTSAPQNASPGISNTAPMSSPTPAPVSQ